LDISKIIFLIFFVTIFTLLGAKLVEEFKLKSKIKEKIKRGEILSFLEFFIYNNLQRKLLKGVEEEYELYKKNYFAKMGYLFYHTLWDLFKERVPEWHLLDFCIYFLKYDYEKSILHIEVDAFTHKSEEFKSAFKEFEKIMKNHRIKIYVEGKGFYEGE